MIQYVSNVSQIGLLVAVVVAAGALAFDAKPEMGVFLRTRVSQIWDILVPRLWSHFWPLAARLCLGSGGLVRDRRADRHSSGRGDVGRNRLRVAVPGAGRCHRRRGRQPRQERPRGRHGHDRCVPAMPIIGIVESIGEWLPSHLVGALAGIPGGTAIDVYLPAAAVTVVLIGLSRGWPFAGRRLGSSGARARSALPGANGSLEFLSPLRADQDLASIVEQQLESLVTAHDVGLAFPAPPYSPASVIADGAIGPCLVRSDGFVGDRFPPKGGKNGCRARPSGPQ